MFFWQSRKPEEPKETQSIAQAFDDFATALSPEMINQIRTERTKTNAQKEGHDTARQDLASRLEPDMRAMLHHMAGAYFPEKQGLRAAQSPEYAEWLRATSQELTQQLARMHHRLVHSPLSGDSLAVEHRVQSIIESSPELLERFDRLCAKFYFCGGVVHSREYSVQSEIYGVLAEVIESRLVGENQPLSFREFSDALERNRAISPIS